MGALTFDSWLKSKQNDFKSTFFERAYKEGVAKEQAKEEALAKSELVTKKLENKISIITQNMEETTANQSKYSNEIEQINTQVFKGDMTPQNAKPHLEYYQHMYKQAEKTHAEEVKELKLLSESNNPDIFNGDFSEYFTNLTEILKDYLNLLSSEQLVIIFNLSGFLYIVMLLTTITMLLIGNDLIHYYQLELKYPKLANYIKFQLRLRSYYLKFYILYLYFVILF